MKKKCGKFGQCRTTHWCTQQCTPTVQHFDAQGCDGADQHTAEHAIKFMCTTVTVQTNIFVYTAVTVHANTVMYTTVMEHANSDTADQHILQLQWRCRPKHCVHYCDGAGQHTDVQCNDSAEQHSVNISNSKQDIFNVSFVEFVVQKKSKLYTETTALWRFRPTHFVHYSDEWRCTSTHHSQTLCSGRVQNWSKSPHVFP